MSGGIILEICKCLNNKVQKIRNRIYGSFFTFKTQYLHILQFDHTKSLQPFCQQLVLSVQVFYNTIFIAVTVSQTNMDVSTRAHKHTHNQKKQ